jgi:DNA-binding transcriptional MocR family regulator
VTVQRAVRLLVAEGLVETRPGAGNFIRHARPAARADYGWQTTALGPARIDRAAIGSTLLPSPDGVISLRESYPSDDLLPVRAVRSALSRAAASRAAVDRPPPAGLPELRAWFARELARLTPHDGDAPTGADVLVVPGGQSALSSTFRALAAPGEAVVMEAPTFWGAIAAARLAELRIVPVAREGDAVAPAVLDDALAGSRAKLFYAQPRFANPSGEAWSGAEAAATMEVLASHGAYLVEDDWAHDFALEGRFAPVASRDRDGRVIYIRSLTKSVSPALRVAAVVARGPARARIETDRTINDLYVSAVLQAAALEVVSAPGRAAHLRSAQTQLRARRDDLARLVTRHLPEGALTRVPAGGLNLWLRLPAGAAATEVAERCALAGLLVSPGDEWFPTEPTGPFLRLNYAGPDPARFEEAIRLLARQLEPRT